MREMGRKWEEEGERRTGKQGITVVADLSQIDLRLGKSAATLPCSSLDKIMLGIPKGEDWELEVPSSRKRYLFHTYSKRQHLQLWNESDSSSSSSC